MTSGNAVRLLLALSCFGILGCRPGLDERCKSGLGERSIFFGGGLHGSGSLNATHQEGNRVQVVLALAVPNQTEPAVVKGTGECVDGVVRMRLGPSSAETNELKVVDGSIVSILSPEPLSEPFGLWEVQGVNKVSGEDVDLVGYWRAQPANSQAIANAP